MKQKNNNSNKRKKKSSFFKSKNRISRNTPQNKKKSKIEEVIQGEKPAFFIKKNDGPYITLVKINYFGTLYPRMELFNPEI